MAITLDTHELAWAAGFFCGEGCTTGQPSSIRRNARAYITVAQSGDPEVLYRFQQAVGGLGKVNGPFAKSGIYKPQYAWNVSSFENVQAVIAMLWPWLSNEKKAQATTRLRAVLAGR